MDIKKSDSGATEGDLEAEIHKAIGRCFPKLPKDSIKHQTTFTFSLCGRTFSVNGVDKNTARIRADILLYWKDRPLAVLELKRNGNSIDEDDIRQGLSYARVMNPMAPLVILTDGSVTKFYESYSGLEWKPSDDDDEQNFSRLFSSVGAAAKHDLKQAIATLMGTDDRVWTQAMSVASTEAIHELSGDWRDLSAPFVETFLIPRKAASNVLEALEGGTRIVVVEGAPLSGKSSVLRDVCCRTSATQNFSFLFMEAASGVGVYRKLADILTDKLAWPVTPQEARDWLVQISHGKGPNLVLAIDAVGGQRDLRQELLDLSSSRFGAALRIVVAVDESIADDLMMSPTRRALSSIGRVAKRIEVGSFDDEEFRLVLEKMDEIRLSMLPGGWRASEYRVPWILRAAISSFLEDPHYSNESLVGVLPPLLGLELMEHVERRFYDPQLQHLFSAVANAVLDGAEDATRSVPLILESMVVYVVRRNTLREYLDSSEIDQMIEQGYLRHVKTSEGLPVLVVRMPHLLAAMLARAMSQRFLSKLENEPTVAVQWLSDQANSFPLSDLVAAQAFILAATSQDGLSFDVLTTLLESPPRQEVMPTGSRAVLYYPGLGPVNVTFLDGGALEVTAKGQRKHVEPDDETGKHISYANIGSWLILSHVGGQPFQVSSPNLEVRGDPMVLQKVGQYQNLLRRPTEEVIGITLHGLPGGAEVVCHQEGIIEPITMSILKFLSRDMDMARSWVHEAIETKSVFLLARTDIALRQLTKSADEEQARFASDMLKDVAAVLSELMPYH